MNEFHGFIFSKLHLIGSKSEGPNYFLQQFDYSELPLAKQAQLWRKIRFSRRHWGPRSRSAAK